MKEFSSFPKSLPKEIIKGTWKPTLDPDFAKYQKEFNLEPHSVTLFDFKFEFESVTTLPSFLPNKRVVPPSKVVPKPSDVDVPTQKGAEIVPIPRVPVHVQSQTSLKWPSFKKSFNKVLPGKRPLEKPDSEFMLKDVIEILDREHIVDIPEMCASMSSDEIYRHVAQKIAWWLLKWDQDPPPIEIVHPEIHDQRILDQGNDFTVIDVDDDEDWFGSTSDPEGIFSKPHTNLNIPVDPDLVAQYRGFTGLEHCALRNTSAESEKEPFLKVWKPKGHYSQTTFKAKCTICDKSVRESEGLAFHITNLQHKKNFLQKSFDLVRSFEVTKEPTAEKVFKAKLRNYHCETSSSLILEKTAVSPTLALAQSSSGGDRDLVLRPDQRLYSLKADLEITNSWTLDKQKLWNQAKGHEKRIMSIYNNKLELYKLNPQDHPKYNEEWEIFYSSQCDKLEKAGIDVESYDFATPWEKVWPMKILWAVKTTAIDKILKMRKELGMDYESLEVLVRDANQKLDDEEYRYYCQENQAKPNCQEENDNRRNFQGQKVQPSQNSWNWDKNRKRSISPSHSSSKRHRNDSRRDNRSRSPPPDNYRGKERSDHRPPNNRGGRNRRRNRDRRRRGGYGGGFRGRNKFRWVRPGKKYSRSSSRSRSSRSRSRSSRSRSSRSRSRSPQRRSSNSFRKGDKSKPIPCSTAVRPENSETGSSSNNPNSLQIAQIQNNIATSVHPQSFEFSTHLDPRMRQMENYNASVYPQSLESCTILDPRIRKMLNMASTNNGQMQNMGSPMFVDLENNQVGVDSVEEGEIEVPVISSVLSQEKEKDKESLDAFDFLGLNAHTTNVRSFLGDSSGLLKSAGFDRKNKKCSKRNNANSRDNNTEQSYTPPGNPPRTSNVNPSRGPQVQPSEIQGAGPHDWNYYYTDDTYPPGENFFMEGPSGEVSQNNSSTATANNDGPNKWSNKTISISLDKMSQFLSN